MYLNRFHQEYALGFGSLAASKPGSRVVNDAVMSVGVRMVHELTNGAVKPVEAQFSHRAPETASACERLLEVPVQFNRNRSCLILKADAFRTPLPRHDPQARRRILADMEEAVFDAPPDENLADSPLLGPSRVNSIPVLHVEIERRAEPLDDGHRAAAATRNTTPASPPPEPDEHRPHVDLHHGAAERVIPGGQAADAWRQRQPPLREGQVRQHAGLAGVKRARDTQADDDHRAGVSVSASRVRSLIGRSVSIDTQTPSRSRTRCATPRSSHHREPG